jgi:hypothetical protein
MSKVASKTLTWDLEARAAKIKEGSILNAEME